jgi:hypothetical protein
MGLVIKKGRDPRLVGVHRRNDGECDGLEKAIGDGRWICRWKMARKRKRKRGKRVWERSVSRREDWTGAGAVEQAKRRKGCKSKSSLFRLTLR